ncbi:LysR substrate-binding domain-containing protein [Bradyrhizobium uaiense]|uniref:LysR family transcriptional regulator n=1 Tax=Bradyrhizobium uaiense TaxID=2594946 RepID=A0A6P1BIW5_9BRAD|nr:LysR substrate-binding domain-containing protein [Bradyrhizobium uaiense]NEU98335.1 LysR family transcriptional regulator [Bradyrhizobium uaiense]
MNLTQPASHRIPFAPLRCFESFARLGNLAAAALELGISPSAVSHQLTALEDHLGVALTIRRGRALVLSADGRNYFEAVSPAFATLQNATAQMKQRELAQPMIVSALPLIATAWLLPRLKAFLARNPDIEIQLQYARYRNYASDAADLSLRFGRGEWIGYDSELLLDGGVVPVCNPAIVRQYGPFAEPRDLLRAPLVHDGLSDGWLRWFAAQGVYPSIPLKGMICEDGLLAGSAASSGMGVALLRPLLIEPQLRAGELVVVSDHKQTDERNYYLCVRNDTEPAPEVRRLKAWLKAPIQGRK